MDIRVDMDAFSKDLGFLEREQFPYAMAKTLTDLATSGQIAVRGKTRKEFKLHTDFIPNNIGIVPARKADVRLGTAKSAVKTSEKISFMSNHETGEDKVPKRKALAIPTMLTKGIPDFKTATGKVKAKFKPAALLKKWNQKDKPAAGETSAYVVDGTLFARVKDKWRTGSRSIPLFGFATQAKIKPKWGFGLTVGLKVAQNAAGYFARNMASALATRK